ncbi:LLM class flavin-dependent oxidoreductase [Dasania marina]|uniref:LLM class flavin-dependent oxidoreductase n=1 Tax=Dasania marina TaxID=471499 RepID=UPI0030DD2CB4|tara:strand:- start:45874 stop:47010 length:1137 start_codon:yes stop_codon:yes gene_type:complete
MKFGYFCNLTNWNNKPYGQLLTETREIAQHCDEAGWDSIWLTEHHLNHEGMDACPNPLMICADIAARTKQIRLGQAANIVPFWNPLRLAEDVAMLDHLSNGRVDCGVGRGVYGREAIHMNPEADVADQAKNYRVFDESLEVIKKAWTQDLFDHKGEFYTYPAPDFKWEHDMSPPNPDFMNIEDNTLTKIGLVPRPLQQPHPPLWQVVDGLNSIELAGLKGMNTIMWIPTVAALKERFQVFQKARSEFKGHQVPLGEGISLVRDMFVADSMDEARELAAEGILTYIRWIAHWRGLGNHMNPGEELIKTPNKLDLLDYDFLHPRNLLFGTPDYVAEKIHELQTELGVEHLQVWSNFPGVPHEQVMKSVKMFSEKVMPKFT